MKSWETLTSEEIYKNPFWTYRKDRFRTSEGVEGDYHVVQNHDAIDAFVQLNDGRFVMQHEYRYLFDRVSLSHVQGGVETGENPEDTAIREIQEEVGYRAEQLIKLGWFAAAPAFSTEVCHAYLARDLTPCERDDNPLERSEVVIMTAEQIDEAIVSGAIWDSQVMAIWNQVKLFLNNES